MAPWIERDLLGNVRCFVRQPGTKCLKTLLSGWKNSSVQLVLSEGLLETIDLNAGRHRFSHSIAIDYCARTGEHDKQRDDRHYGEHYDPSYTRLEPSHQASCAKVLTNIQHPHRP